MSPSRLHGADLSSSAGVVGGERAATPEERINSRRDVYSDVARYLDDGQAWMY